MSPLTDLQHFGHQLEALLPPEEILPQLVEKIRAALREAYVAVTLPAPDETHPPEVLAETAGRAVGGGLHLASRWLLEYQHEVVGELFIETPHALTAEQHTLLTTIARQAGTAVYLVRLTRDLRRAREHLVLTREEERRRLRRELHDSIGPTLAALNLKASAVRALINLQPAAAQSEMTELREQIRTVITDIRRVVYDLRPPALDELGMLPAIREQARQFGSAGLQVLIEAPATLPTLPAAVEVAAYRIVLEALTNVSRHANAHICQIHLHPSDTELLIVVEDDGVGFPDDYRVGVGLTSMSERAVELGGTFNVTALPNGGTQVTARLPLSL